MPMIFPGMDPYLENSVLWSGIHARLVVGISNFLQPLLRPRYIAAVEERVFVEGPEDLRIPDIWISKKKRARGGVAVLEADAPVVVKVPGMEIHESYVNILDRDSGLRVVTVIEVTSPTNKYEGPGRESYLTKQKEVRQSQTHLVEVDLLRAGKHVLAVAEWVARGQGPYHYLACVNRAQGLREEFDLYPRTLTQRLPRIRIPLADSDPDVPLDLQMTIEQVYEDGAYADRIDYTKPCRPPLSKTEQTWANQLIKKARGRKASPKNNGKRRST